MAPAAAPLDPLAEIATPEALHDWLDGLDLADLAPRFIERGLLGQTLLETDPADLAALAGPAAGLLGKQLERLRRRRAALTPALTPALSRSGRGRAFGRVVRSAGARGWRNTVREVDPSPVAPRSPRRRGHPLGLVKCGQKIPVPVSRFCPNGRPNVVGLPIFQPLSSLRISL